ncbi:DUF86 domain-containing protein [Candidatus Berkelbacteria bacterium]|nr:DUF86 domain-containing protein [Candidatus Berkelbacteria bacterium]
MTPRSVRLYVQDMVESIEKIQTYVTSKSYLEFIEDFQLQDAVLRRFMILGEAATQLPEDVREQYADVP